jgi:hypothetical protein
MQGGDALIRTIKRRSTETVREGGALINNRGRFLGSQKAIWWGA